MTRFRSLMFRLALAAALAVPAVALAPGGNQAAEAVCSIGATDYADAAMTTLPRTQLLLVGTVTDERSIRRGTRTFYESVVEPQVMLKGEAPDEPIVLPFLGHLGADCSGGPRLLKGERVLLPVYWGRASYGDGESAWQLTGIFSKVALQDGVATLQWHLGSERLGESEDIIRTYGEAVGATDGQIEAAIAAALTPDGAGAGDSTRRIVALAVTAGAVIVIAAGVLRRRSRSEGGQP